MLHNLKQRTKVAFLFYCAFVSGNPNWIISLCIAYVCACDAYGKYGIVYPIRPPQGASSTFVYVCTYFINIFGSFVLAWPSAVCIFERASHTNKIGCTLYLSDRK